MEFEEHAFRRPAEVDMDPWRIPPDKVLDFDSVVKSLSSFRVVKVLISEGDVTDPASKLDDGMVGRLRSDETIRTYITDQQKVAQIVHASTDKESAIARLCTYKHYQNEQVAFFGDDEPDRDALISLPYGIAMDNALGHIKQAARYVTLDHDNSGVGHAIYNTLRIL